MLTQSELMEILNYDPNTGEFIWKIHKKGIKDSLIAGSIKSTGYIDIVYNKNINKAHRLAWLYMTGNWPTKHIDHINGIRNDNRWCNLREASFAENAQNKAMSKNNTSGYTGVSWRKSRNKWQAMIFINKKRIHLGTFDDPYEAHMAYLDAKSRLHTFNPTPR